LEKHHNKKDINERKMDEEVHGFSADNVQPYPNDRSSVNPGYNGNENVYPPQKFKKGKKSFHQKHHKKRDIAERNMDEEVHGFASDNVMPYAWNREETAPGYNGNKNVYPAQRTKKSLN